MSGSRTPKPTRPSWRPGEDVDAVKNRGDHLLGLGATPTSPAAGGFIQQKIQRDYPVMDRAAASKALLGQHTATEPQMSLTDAMARLEQRAGAPLNPEAVSKDAGLQDAAMAMLKYRFTPVDFEALDGVDETTAMSVALDVMPHFDDAHRKELLDEVVFNFAHPAAHHATWSGVIRVVPPDEMEAAILDRARSDNELHVNNAIHLPYYIYGRSPQYPLSDAGRAQLEGIISDLGTRPGLNPLVREGLNDVRIPVNV